MGNVFLSIYCSFIYYIGKVWLFLWLKDYIYFEFNLVFLLMFCELIII